MGNKFDFGDVDESDILDETNQDKKESQQKITIAQDSRQKQQLATERGSSHGPPQQKTQNSKSGLDIA